MATACGAHGVPREPDAQRCRDRTRAWRRRPACAVAACNRSV